MPCCSRKGRTVNSAAAPLGDRGPVSTSTCRPEGVLRRAASPCPTSKNTRSRVGLAPRPTTDPQTATVRKRELAITQRHRRRGRGHCAMATSPAPRAPSFQKSGVDIRIPAQENQSAPYRDVARSPCRNRSAALPKEAAAAVHTPPMVTVTIADVRASPVHGIPIMFRNRPAADTHPKW